MTKKRAVEDYALYWEGFKALWTMYKKDIHDCEPKMPKGKPYLEFAFPFKLEGVHFALNLHDLRIFCELVLDMEDRKEILEELERRERKIAEDLKIDIEDLTFAFSYKPRRVHVVCRDLDPADEHTRHEQYGWMLDKLKLFYGYFPGLLTEMTKG